MSQHISSFIADLAVHFGKRHETTEAEEAWLRSMVACLRNYSRETLDAAAKKIIASRDERTFPLPAECMKVCDEIAKQEVRTAKRERLPFDKRETFSDWQWRNADELVKCPLGQQAAREGWILSMHDFARKHGRLPTGHDITECKAAAKGFDEAYTLCLRGEAGACNAALLKLGNAMIARRKQLAETVLAA